MRDPSTARYAIYDFGYSLIYPYETVLEDVTETRFLNFELRDLPIPDGPYNPFQEDIAFLGMTLQRWVRVRLLLIFAASRLIQLQSQHIENIVPEIGPFFESMINSDAKKRFTARQALEEFQRIKTKLTPSQLNHEVTGIHWENGTYLATISFGLTLHLLNP
jgi:hypothetical protein